MRSRHCPHTNRGLALRLVDHIWWRDRPCPSSIELFLISVYFFLVAHSTFSLYFILVLISIFHISMYYLLLGRSIFSLSTLSFPCASISTVGNPIYLGRWLGFLGRSIPYPDSGQLRSMSCPMFGSILQQTILLLDVQVDLVMFASAVQVNIAKVWEYQSWWTGSTPCFFNRVSILFLRTDLVDYLCSPPCQPVPGLFVATQIRVCDKLLHPVLMGGRPL